MSPKLRLERTFFFLAATFTFFIPSILFSSAHQINIGPELSHIKRIRKGGTKQTGMLYGVRGTYDYIGRYLIYWGFEGACSTGTLKGKTGNGNVIKSHFTENNVEGRIGYTFQSKDKSLLSITPFVGIGYFKELNHYISPSEVKVHFDNRFNYGAAGCLLRGCFTPNFRFGLNATARWSLDGKVKISHDPNAESTTIEYMQKMQARASLPFWYKTTCATFSVECGIAPFYEYRHYGRKVGVPFDFIDTRIKSWGCDFFYTFCF
jgi:hypothetical protein